MHETFGPQVKECPKEKQLPLKCLLVMDSTNAHPQDVDDDLSDGFGFIKEKFVAPNTTPIFHPMDQQVISNIKKLYARALLRKCFELKVQNEDVHERLKSH